MIFFLLIYFKTNPHLDGGLVGGDDGSVGVGDESIGPRGQGGGGAVGAQAVRAVAGGGGRAGGEGQEGELRAGTWYIVINYN